MQAVIYAGLRNGHRDQAIHDALAYKHVKDVAEEFRLSPNTIRAASKRIAKITVYDLTLLGGQADAYRQGCLQLLPQGGSWRLPELPRNIPEPGSALLGNH